MTSIRITRDQWEWIGANPLPWWDPDARWLLDRPAFGPPVLLEPVNEPAESEGPPPPPVPHPDDVVGWEFDGLDADDALLFSVIEAGRGYVEAAGDNGPALVEMQRAADEQTFARLRQAVETGALAPSAAADLARAELHRQARTLGIEPPPPPDPDARPEPPTVPGLDPERLAR